MDQPLIDWESVNDQLKVSFSNIHIEMMFIQKLLQNLEADRRERSYKVN